jgi:AraC-like DNA-binding protein
MDFKIITPGADELLLQQQLPPSFAGLKLFDSSSITASLPFGEMVFQHHAGNGFDIWYSNYFISKPLVLQGKADIPVLELHIQFLNQFDIMWDGFGRNTLKPYQYNISYTPFVDNKASFAAGRDYHTFDIHFSLDFLEGLAPSSGALSQFLEKVYKKQASTISDIDRFLTPEMVRVVNQILHCDFREGLNRFYIDCKVKELFVMVLDHVSDEHSLIPIKLSEYDIEKLYEVKGILLADFEEKLTLTQISRKIGLNEYKLKKGFKYLFGSTVFGYRHAIRMEKARQIILETKLPFADIAYMTGFEHPENFQKAFKKFFGYSAAKLRKG